MTNNAAGADNALYSRRLRDRIESAGGSDAYGNYLLVRDSVLRMLDLASGDQVASAYWREELDGMEYMLDASPLVVSSLRHHCYHLTGLRDYDYRSHHSHQQRKFASKLAMLKALDSAGLFVPESPMLGGFGHNVDGALCNIDTLKYYECLIAMDRAGILGDFRGAGRERKIVMEIGSGWGGLAYQFKTVCPNTCYVLVDLPQVLLFSGTYLKTLFPEAKILICDSTPEDGLIERYRDYDFVLVPHFFAGNLTGDGLDLLLNTVSFQEMTDEQVEGYAQLAHRLGCRRIYSLNREKSKHNNQLTSVSKALSEYYELTEIPLLDIPYLVLERPAARSGFIALAKRIVRGIMGGQFKRPLDDYRHFVGSRK